MPTTSTPAPARAAKPLSYSLRYFSSAVSFLLHLDQVALGGADPLGAFALGARRGLLDISVETFGTLHAGAFWLGGHWQTAGAAR